VHKPPTYKDFSNIVSAATVNAGATTSTTAYFDTRPYSERYARIRVKSDQAYSFTVWAGPASATSVTSCSEIYTASGQAASANNGRDHFVPIAGAGRVFPVVKNDSASAATITVDIMQFND